MKVILALDLSKHCTGWAIGGGVGSPLVDSVSFDGRYGRGDALAGYFAWLRDRLLTNSPDLVVYEAPIFSGVPTSADKMMLLVGMAAITEAVCSMKSTRMISVAAPTWRKAFLGPKWQDAKPEAERLCSLLGWKTTNPDEAEACGVWAWAHLNHGDADAMRGQLSRARVRGMESADA